MHIENHTLWKYFILQGLTEDKRLKHPLFVLFSLVYIVTLMGNLVMMALIKSSPRLHTAMYFLIGCLSFVDICYSSVITPNMLVNFLSDHQVISLPACFVQIFFFASFASIDGFLLGVMAYDRYNAVCNPLRYQIIMTRRVCVSLVAVAGTIGTINSIIHTTVTLRLKFCSKNIISHFYCDIPPLLKISCSDTTINEIVLFTVAGSLQVGSLLIIIISYTFIVSAILRISSSSGKRRASATCASHFACVTLLYAPVLFMYLRPSSIYSMDQDKVASLFYTVIIPMLNPLVYSLRNKDVKIALSAMIKKVCFMGGTQKIIT